MRFHTTKSCTECLHQYVCWLQDKMFPETVSISKAKQLAFMCGQYKSLTMLATTDELIIRDGETDE